VSTASLSARGHLEGIARGGAVGLLGAACSSVCAFALVIVVTRGLPAAQAGRFFTATSVFLILAALASLGTETGLARFLLRHAGAGNAHDLRATIRAAAGPVLLASVFCALVMALAATTIARILDLGGSGVALLRILAVAVPCAVAAELCLATTRALGNMHSTALIDGIARSLLQPALALLALSFGGGLVLVGAGWATAYVASLTLAYPVARRYVRTQVPVATKQTAGPVSAAFWSFTWPRGLTRVAQIVVQKADIILVAALVSPAHAAIYTAATRFVALGQFATQALQRAIQPRLTLILLDDDRATLREVYRVTTAWNISLTWPVYVVIGCAPAAYLSLFGDGYAVREATWVVVVMLAAMLLAVASGPVDTLLLMSGRSRASLANALAAATVDIVVCLLLIPALGMVGAALAWGLAVLTRCLLAFIQVRRSLGVTPVGREVAMAGFLVLALIGVPVSVFSLLGGERLASLSAVAALSAGGYATALWLLRQPLHLDLLASTLRRSGSGPVVHLRSTS
jgi:O-antigen/teichoic acid export membrane protein